MWPFSQKRSLTELDKAHAEVDAELDKELTLFSADMETTQLRPISGVAGTAVQMRKQGRGGE